MSAVAPIDTTMELLLLGAAANVVAAIIGGIVVDEWRRWRVHGPSEEPRSVTVLIAVRSQPIKEGRMPFTFSLEHEDGSPAEPPAFSTAGPNWSPGDSIPP